VLYSLNSTIDSFLLDDYAERKGIIIKDNIPFDDIFLVEFKEEYENFKKFMEQLINKEKISNCINEENSDSLRY
jgi:hypothetical protein